MRVTRFTPFLSLLLVLALTACPHKPQVAANAGTVSHPPVDTSGWSGNAQDFSFAAFSGKTMKLSSLAGKPVVLNFWADW